MCGGIGFNLSDIDEAELQMFFDDETIAGFKETGIGLSFFWDKNPALPVVEIGKGVRLLSWGNRDKNVLLPKTGWAKSESLESGKWNCHKPCEVTIPALKGYEKGVWFPVKKGIRGIKIKKNGEEKVYLVTKEASLQYLKLTGHKREPYTI